MNTEQKSNSNLIFKLTAILFLAFGLFALYLLILKPDLPFSYKSVDSVLISKENFKNIKSGDTIYSILNFHIKEEFEVEYLLDSKSVNDSVDINILSQGTQNKITVTLGHAYPDYLFVIFTFISGISFWITSLFVLIKKPKDKSAFVLFWLLLVFSYDIMTSGGKISDEYLILCYI